MAWHDRAHDGCCAWRAVIHQATRALHRQVAYALPRLDLHSLDAPTRLTVWRQHWHIEIASLMWLMAHSTTLPAASVLALPRLCCLPSAEPPLPPYALKVFRMLLSPSVSLLNSLTARFILW